MPFSVGDKLGPYEILAPIGAGGMGEVYKARDARLARDVALKILPVDVLGDVSRRQRFELEARAVAALNHSNIVSVYDVGAEAGHSYIVMELVDGKPLRGVKLSLRRALAVAVQIADGLAAAHAAGISHRDLKPDNIMLTQAGRAKILDFGLAKVTPAPADAGTTQTMGFETEPGQVMGTAGYMSPEQVRGLTVDYRSDIFSFGAILYELLAGKRAFDGGTKVETMTGILKDDPPELPHSVPGPIRQIVAHCLEKDPKTRFQSARDLSFVLSAYSQSGIQDAASPLARRSIWKAAAWPTVGLAALAAFVLITVSVGASTFLWRDPPAPAWSGVFLGGPEVAVGPRESPDGHTLAFAAMVGDNLQVGIMKPETGNRQMLSHRNDFGSVNAVSWSPDGTRLYFDRWNDMPRGVFSVPALGGEERLLLEDAASPEALSDGSVLVVRQNAERRLQLFRFWPETGQLRAFPLAFAFDPNLPAVRIFPDGTEAVGIGTLIGAGREAGQHIYVVNLESGSVRQLPSGLADDSKLSAVAVAHDGKTVLVASFTGFTRISAVPSSGRGPARTLLTFTSLVWSLDRGAGESIYLDQVERPKCVLRFHPEGGHVERIATVLGETADDFAVLPDGRAVLQESVGGRTRLMILESGKDPVPLVNTAEDTAVPAAAVGHAYVGFLIGPEPRRIIAIVEVSSGRITRRIHFDKGPIKSLASAPDGKTLYCVAGGTVWAIPVSGEEPRKIRAGDAVSVDPTGLALLVEIIGVPVDRLVRVPLNGGPKREIPRVEPFGPAAIINAGAMGKDGRILTPLGASTWPWLPGLIDSSTGRSTRIQVDNSTDFHSMAWTSDGRIMAVGLDLRSTMWRFQRDVN